MKWLWISGWAAPTAWLASQAQAAWPEHAHEAVRPLDARRRVAARDYETVCGYSLGAWWLLRHAEMISPDMPVMLFAPIFAFPAEAGCGGKISRARLRQQRRHLRKDPAAAVAEFARHAGLDGLPLPEANEAAKDFPSLDEELGWLEESALPVPPPAHWRGWIGENDPLLDAARLRELWPALRVVRDAGHAPAPLFHAAAKETRA